jgi:hypothetical protein
MRKTPLQPQEKERSTIAPAQLAHLALYSPAYSGFTLVGWPADVAYPNDAKSLTPRSVEKNIQDWDAFHILQAFCAGSAYGAKPGTKKWCHLLKFKAIEWSKHIYMNLIITGTLRLSYRGGSAPGPP